jgi:Asp-tRNA(Asn)/Glu-tRNA(Gln) amidotransferase B subunit
MVDKTYAQLLADDDELLKIIRPVIDRLMPPQAVILGECMKTLHGKANPTEVLRLVKTVLHTRYWYGL